MTQRQREFSLYAGKHRNKGVFPFFVFDLRCFSNGIGNRCGKNTRTVMQSSKSSANSVVKTTESEIRTAKMPVLSRNLRKLSRMTMPQPRGCRGSSKVRAVNSISRICRFPSPIKTHFLSLAAPKVKKISHRSGFFTDPERGTANSAKDTLPTLRRSVSFLCVAAIRTENTAFSRLVLTTAFSDG